VIRIFGGEQLKRWGPDAGCRTTEKEEKEEEEVEDAFMKKNTWLHEDLNHTHKHTKTQMIYIALSKSHKHKHTNDIYVYLLVW